MRQVLIDNRGRVDLVEVPTPMAQSGYVLVRTAYSLISSGTEIATLQHQSQGLIQTALERPELVKNLAQQVRAVGLSATFDTVTGKLKQLNPIGYSLAGRVIETGSDVDEFAEGHAVACSGAEYAHHAEVVCVPRRLVARVPKGVSLQAAAFGGLGAIALQGVRRSQVAIGETIVVIGLGLIGQLTGLLLNASGCRVIGVEPQPERAELAKRLGMPYVLSPDTSDPVAAVKELTQGLGADAVLVCAATTSSRPVNQAFAIARERGRVVVVGDVGLELQRDEFYRKELDLFLSRSLGPGRYDPVYEEQGVDYPPAYVRWTEQRNMKAFLQLLAEARVNVEPLISAEFDVDDAAQAYEHLQASNNTLAILLRYETSATEQPPSTDLRRSVQLRPSEPVLMSQMAVGLIGAGAFARSVHLPNLKRSREFAVRAVASRKGVDARNAGQRVGAAYVTTDANEIFADPKIEVVWITTPHDSHAELAIRALEAGKHVFVEKPLALTLEDCCKVREAVARSGCLLTVGFNRRFAPASQLAREHFIEVSSSKQILYRVRADVLPDGHWLDDPQRGGGRLLGECVHFFDWMAWFLDEEPQRVWASRSPEDEESLTAVLQFEGGSVGTLIYTCAGAPVTPKERIEILGGGRTAIVDNFQSVELYQEDKRVCRRRANGKGYSEQLQAFARALRGKASLRVTVDDGIQAIACALTAEAALREGVPQKIRLQ